MLEKIQDHALPILIENKSLKAVLALIGAILVAAGFQGYSLAFVPPGVLVALGILTEVSLVYVVSIGIERARQDILKQRQEINCMLIDIREVSQNVDEAKNQVDDVRRDVERTKSEISDAQQEVQDASQTAQNAKREIETMKQSFSNAGRRN